MLYISAGASTARRPPPSSSRPLRPRRPDSGLNGPVPGSRHRVNKPQAPESAEIRTQEQVRTQDDEAGNGRGPGEGRIQEALETAAEVAEKTGGLGTPGRPVNRRSPFMIGMIAAFGVAVAYGVIELLVGARSVVIVIGLAMFIAAGLD